MLNFMTNEVLKSQLTIKTKRGSIVQGHTSHGLAVPFVAVRREVNDYNKMKTIFTIFPRVVQVMSLIRFFVCLVDMKMGNNQSLSRNRLKNF